jgi:hypothetical protein
MVSNKENIFSVPPRKTHALGGREDINLSVNNRLFITPSVITLIIIQGISEFLDFVNTAFQKLDLFPFTGENVGGTHSIGSIRSILDLDTFVNNNYEWII